MDKLDTPLTSNSTASKELKPSNATIVKEEEKLEPRRPFPYRR